MKTEIKSNRQTWMLPAIPLPYFGIFKRCSCGKKFISLKGYEKHYIINHVYRLYE